MALDLDSLTVVNNEARNRYEIDLGEGRVALAAYSPVGNDRIIFSHTEVPEAFAGQGVGDKLIREALADVARRGRSIIPLCPFVAAFIKRRPEYRRLVWPGYKLR